MNKIVIITGVSKGLGLSVANQLLSIGYSVAGFSRKKTSQIKKIERKFKNKFFFLN